MDALKDMKSILDRFLLNIKDKFVSKKFGNTTISQSETAVSIFASESSGTLSEFSSLGVSGKLVSINTNAFTSECSIEMDPAYNNYSGLIKIDSHGSLNINASVNNIEAETIHIKSPNVLFGTSNTKPFINAEVYRANPITVGPNSGSFIRAEVPAGYIPVCVNFGYGAGSNYMVFNMDEVILMRGTGDDSVYRVRIQYRNVHPTYTFNGHLMFSVLCIHHSLYSMNVKP